MNPRAAILVLMAAFRGVVMRALGAAGRVHIKAATVSQSRG